MQGLIHLLSPFAKSRRGGQLVTWLLGLLIFFDDYANTILLGGTLRPVCDKLRISREKLAYLVDSTAAPVAGLSILSTWVAVEIEYVKEGIDALGASDLKAIDLFLGSIPYRFYILGSLAFIPMVALSGRDFGSMLRAERRRLSTPDSELDEATVGLDSQPQDVPARWYNAVLPVVVTLGVVMALMYKTGLDGLRTADPDAPENLRNILGSARSSFSLQYGALVGLSLALLLAKVQRLAPWRELVDAVGKGAKLVLPAIAILWCASALSRMTTSTSVDGESTPASAAYKFKDHRLYTGDFLAQSVLVAPSRDADANGPDNSTAVRLFPTIVFLLAAVLSFATGTSFGTMGIMLPMVVTLAHALLGAEAASVSGSSPILLASVGGVLAGAVFGDHCSPISDTTILSSQSCVCDHVAHVMTQIPYAVAVAVVSILLGTLPIGWGVSVWLLLPVQVIALWILLRVMGNESRKCCVRETSKSLEVTRGHFVANVALLAFFTFFSIWRAEAEEHETTHTREPVVLTEAARALHQRALVIDGHNDLPWELRSQGSLSFERLDLSKPIPSAHTDIPRLRQGGVGGQFWSVYVPASTAYDGTALVATLEQIEMVHAMIDRYPETFELALTVDDVERIHAQGKIASLIGVEGGHCIENSLSVLNQLYRLGARYMTLTHSDSLDWADSATDEPRVGGLSPFGEDVIREMNRLGMLVDLSHVSIPTMRHALRITKAPVIFSHSSARAVADHPRNVPDDILRLTKQNGGVVMVNYYSGYVVPSSAKFSYERMLEQERLEETLDAADAKAALTKWEAGRKLSVGDHSRRD